ncbi:hypothetical protein WME99_23090 [Sorangium sp. So ce136]|uniref:hypothetical protein n=1 Tax=Sorangium sp. So ce136 TaxID=3133284 RepID=UPI003F0DA8A1
MSTSYTFRVLDADGSVFGKGCFTYDGPPGDDYLTQTAKADASLLKGRTGAQATDDETKEDAARAIEDIATHFDWRPGAVRNTNRAIEVAK